MRLARLRTFVLLFINNSFVQYRVSKKHSSIANSHNIKKIIEYSYNIGILYCILKIYDESFFIFILFVAVFTVVISEISENDDTEVRGALKKFPEWWYCTAMVGLMAMLT